MHDFWQQHSMNRTKKNKEYKVHFKARTLQAWKNTYAGRKGADCY